MIRSLIVTGILLASIGSTRMMAQTRIEFEQRRQKLIDEVIAPTGITDPRVLRAMRETSRHEFVPLDLRAKAYFDMGLPIGNQQTISSPLIVSQMTQALKPRGDGQSAGNRHGQRLPGRGPQPAGRRRCIQSKSWSHWAERPSKCSIGSVTRTSTPRLATAISVGRSMRRSTRSSSPARPRNVPQPLVDQLAEGGLMAIPVGERYSQTLYLFTKKGDKLEKEALLPTCSCP